ncbi:PD-(D/E)XK nuclease family protein [Myxococcota bacterium]|nr:PD-(D/E)XK nuclease family protein [Myxococcota bacterium]
MSLRFRDADRRVILGVHDLLSVGPREGSLRLNLAQSQQARMAAGRAVHEDVQASRLAEDEEFIAEHSIRVTFPVLGWDCTIRGRLDGLSREAGQLWVEEYKSTGLNARMLADTRLEDWPDYRAQVALYCWLLSASGAGSALGRLVLVSLADSSRRTFIVRDPIDETRAWVEAQLTWLITRREERNAHFAARRAVPVPFAHESVRPLQEDISAQVQASLDEGRVLLLAAPTGSGKTAAALHGALRSCYEQGHKLFVATAKGTQQRLFEETLGAIAAQGLPLRAVSIRAREKACLNGVVDCRPEVCSYAAGYFERAPAAADRLVRRGLAPPHVVRAEAEAVHICTFELSLEVAERADVVVGDFNYAFNPRATLRRVLADPNERWVVLVDEAHNLVERAREQWSPELRASDAAAAIEELRDADPGRFAANIQIMEELEQLIVDAGLDIDGPVSDQGEAVVGLRRGVLRDLRDRVDELAIEYALARRDRPTDGGGDSYQHVARALIDLVAALDEAEQYGASEDLVAIWRGRPRPALKLVCLDPSAWMGRRFAELQGAVLMSATLSPPSFYRDLLGLPEERVDIVEHASPFPPDNLHVVVAPRISTTYRDREAHRAKTGALLGELIQATPGNVAIFYSAFSLLRDLAPLAEVPGRESLVQRPKMSEDERLTMLDRLREIGPPRALHAVLGGVFAEGVDLPGGILQTVIIVGPALPQVGLERELMQERFETRYGQGFLYAYLTPGMSRVVQAAGRLLRGPEDRGVVVLVDRRFGWRDYAAFYPPWWTPRSAVDPAAEVAGFWRPGQGGAR